MRKRNPIDAGYQDWLDERDGWDEEKIQLEEFELEIDVSDQTDWDRWEEWDWNENEDEEIDDRPMILRLPLVDSCDDVGEWESSKLTSLFQHAIQSSGGGID